MGLLDQIVNVANSLGREKGVNQGLIDGLVDLFKSNGVQGMLNNFNQAGLGKLVSSWIGTGSNMPISNDEIMKALGPEKMELLAKKAGLNINDSSQSLKDIIPEIINKITPDGTLTKE